MIQVITKAQNFWMQTKFDINATHILLIYTTLDNYLKDSFNFILFFLYFFGTWWNEYQSAYFVGF